MTKFNWEGLLKQFSQKLIANLDECGKAEIPPEVIEPGWLGYPGATEEQITQAESRLGMTLSTSYREFLKVTNGWRNSDWTEIQLWSTEEVDWFCVRNQYWIDAWSLDPDDERPSVPDESYFVYGKEQGDLRREYLQTALEISSDSGDGDIYLLNPQIVTPDGEWEAWYFGNKIPGAIRYRSFYEMMQQAVSWGVFTY